MQEEILSQIRDLLNQINEREKARDLEYKEERKKQKEAFNEATKHLREQMDVSFKSGIKEGFDFPEGHPFKELLKLGKKAQEDRDRDRDSFKPVKIERFDE